MKSQPETFRILVIDDTPTIHEDFRKVLGSAASEPALDDLEAKLFGDDAAKPSEATHQFEVDSAMQGQEGLAKLKAAIAEGRPYAMAFVDMRMPPGWDGVQTIRELWKVEPTLNVAICTAYSDYTPDQVASELRLDGRMLILRKPFDKTEVRQLAAALCEKWAMGHRKAELEKIVEARTAEFKHAALHDALTGLPNRVLFADRLNHTLLQSRRNPDHKFAVLFIDIDEFKIVNDSLGHDAGDELLLEMSDRMKICVRGVDTVCRGGEGQISSSPETMPARLGGDEFAVLLDNIRSDSDAARIAERLLEAVRKPFVIKGHTFRGSVSIGITTNSLDYERSEDMLRDADTAMYHAKRDGRSRYVMFDQEMHETAVARLTFESDLRNAIAYDHIVPFYQPIVDMSTNKLVGFELLARWLHPIKGAIPPLEFIPTAEETGMIIPLGLKILGRACEQLAEWSKLLPAGQELTMSVNLSRKQLLNADIVQHVEDVIKGSGIKASNLKLEITESCIMSDTSKTVEILKSLQKLGVQLHIDDFGTGYSSLSCLQMFPLDGLKVDRAFLKDVAERQEQLPLLRAIVTLAKAMNMNLVTEGVETPQQEALLKSLGCDLAQGYLYSKPMDAKHAADFISEHIAAAAATKAA